VTQSPMILHFDDSDTFHSSHRPELSPTATWVSMAEIHVASAPIWNLKRTVRSSKETALTDKSSQATRAAWDFHHVAVVPRRANVWTVFFATRL
jgi:hypothetical protein